MGYEEILKTISLRVPSTAFSARQYHIVKASSSEGYFAIGTTMAATALNTAIGVLQDAPTVAGEACQIAPFGSGGISKLVCGSTKLSPGKYVVVGTSGRAQSTASAVARDTIIGPWLSAAAAAGTVGSVVTNTKGITT